MFRPFDAETGVTAAALLNYKIRRLPSFPDGGRGFYAGGQQFPRRLSRRSKRGRMLSGLGDHVPGPQANSNLKAISTRPRAQRLSASAEYFHRDPRLPSGRSSILEMRDLTFGKMSQGMCLSPVRSAPKRAAIECEDRRGSAPTRQSKGARPHSNAAKSLVCTDWGTSTPSLSITRSIPRSVTNG